LLSCTQQPATFPVLNQMSFHPISSVQVVIFSSRLGADLLIILLCNLSSFPYVPHAQSIPRTYISLQSWISRGTQILGFIIMKHSPTYYCLALYPHAVLPLRLRTPSLSFPSFNVPHQVLQPQKKNSKTICGFYILIISYYCTGQIAAICTVYQHRDSVGCVMWRDWPTQIVHYTHTHKIKNLTICNCWYSGF